MSAPRMLLLDEPSLGLAPTIVKQLFQAIAGIREQGVTVLIVEQNVRSVLSFVDRAYVIENGSVELSVPPRNSPTIPTWSMPLFRHRLEGKRALTMPYVQLDGPGRLFPLCLHYRRFPGPKHRHAAGAAA